MHIYISAWNFNRQIQKKKITLESVIELAARHHFAGVEIMDRQFNLKAVERIKAAALQANIKIILGVSSDLTHKNKMLWRSQVGYVLKMLKVAQALECPKVRILLGGQSISFQKMLAGSGNNDTGKPPSVSDSSLKKMLTHPILSKLSHTIRKNQPAKIKDLPQKMERAVLALKNIMPAAEKYDIRVVIENHWGISSYPKVILDIIAKVGSPYLGTCPDFDNFPADIEPYAGLAQLMQKAGHVHAKSRTFNQIGEEEGLDYKRIMEIFRACNYQDTITIEYEGGGDTLEGFLITRNLIKRHM
jgi:sugar phosphate isomerase/epimerase